MYAKNRRKRNGKKIIPLSIDPIDHPGPFVIEARIVRRDGERAVLVHDVRTFPLSEEAA